MLPRAKRACKGDFIYMLYKCVCAHVCTCMCVYGERETKPVFYNSIIHHLHTVLCVHHPSSSLLSSSFMPPIPSSTSPHPPSSMATTTLKNTFYFIFYAAQKQCIHFDLGTFWCGESINRTHLMFK